MADEKQGLKEMYLGNCEELDCEHFRWCGDYYGHRNTECICLLNGERVYRYDAKERCVKCPMEKTYDDNED